MQFRPEPDIRFNNIHEIGGLKAWLERVFMAVFYGYQPNSMADEPTFKPMATYIPRLYLASTTILGPIRLRQLRVEANSCIKDVRCSLYVHGALASIARICSCVRQSLFGLFYWYRSGMRSMLKYVGDKVEDFTACDDGAGGQHWPRKVLQVYAYKNCFRCGCTCMCTIIVPGIAGPSAGGNQVEKC